MIKEGNKVYFNTLDELHKTFKKTIEEYENIKVSSMDVDCVAVLFAGSWSNESH